MPESAPYAFIYNYLYIYTHMHQPLYIYISITTSHWSTFSFNGSRAKPWQIYQVIQMFNPIQPNSSYGTHWIIFPRPQLTRHNPGSQLRTKMPRRRRLNFHEDPAISPKTNYLKQGNENPESPGVGDRKEVPLVKMFMQIFARKGSMIPLNPWHPPHFVCRFLTPKKNLFNSW